MRKEQTTTKVPVLRRHKRSRRAYARFNGTDLWFGPWSDPRKPEPETRAAFDAHLARWLANDRRPLDEERDDLTVGDLADRWLRFLERQRGETWGSKSKNRNQADKALDPLRRLYGIEPAASFGPRDLKAVRQAMIDVGGCRKTINEKVQVVRRCFRWGVAEGYVPSSVIEGLRAVDHLRRGEHGVPEGKGSRKPVEEAVFRETVKHLHPVMAAIVELLWLTGARVGEILNLCPADLGRTGKVWTAQLAHHKNATKGKSRELAFGPKAQELLRPFLDRVPSPVADKPILSPVLAMAHVRHLRRKGRKTPLTDSFLRRYERERAERDRLRLGDRYDASAVRIAVERAVGRANRKRAKRRKDGKLTLKQLPDLPVWVPYQLRHAALSRIRLARGREVAQAVGGHAAPSMTEHYTGSAEAAMARAAMAELG